MLIVALLETKMPRARGTLRITLSLLLSMSLFIAPIWGDPGSGAATVLSAERAHLGTATASVGATVFAGDQIGTEKIGSLQIRAGAARVMLTGESHLIWGAEDGASSSATLTGGTATFSTAAANAFVLHAATAAFKPRDNEPTIANVTLLNPKELVVRCSRGALLIAVEDDVRLVTEGTAYHVVLDPGATPPPGAVPAPSMPASWGQDRPIKAGKSRFIWYAIAITAIVTSIVLWKALESPDGP